MAKSDLPNTNVIGSGNLTNEMSQYNYLYSLIPRTTTTDITFTSSSSNIVYSTATYSSGKFANQGQNGMLSLLGEILASNLITSTDFNNKTETSAFNAHLADLTAHATKANLTYYVDTTNGLDTNDGLSAGVGHAFKTIAKAVNMLPQIVNHTVTINVAAGTYAEGILLSGYSGKGTITINGGTSLATAVNFIVQNVFIISCACQITINGLTVNTVTTNSYAFQVVSCINIFFQWCLTTVTGTSLYGFVIGNSLVYIDSCQCSNKQIALYGIQLSTILSSNWTVGTGNLTGLYSSLGSTIAKNGAQPQGTTAETSVTGGVIR